MSPRTEFVHVAQHGTTFHEIGGVALERGGFTLHEIPTPLPSGIQKGSPHGGGDGCAVGRELVEGVSGHLVRAKADDCHGAIV